MPQSSNADPRPPMWVGHISLSVPDVEKSKQFFLDAGLRDAVPKAPVGILELRGGTHLVLLPRDGTVPADAVAPFDLMVDELDETWKKLSELGFQPSPIDSNRNHRFFTVREPGGHAITVNSTHATGLPV